MCSVLINMTKSGGNLENITVEANGSILNLSPTGFHINYLFKTFEQSWISPDSNV